MVNLNNLILCALSLIHTKNTKDYYEVEAIIALRQFFISLSETPFLMKETVRILVVRNAVEANLLDEILTEKDIPHLIRSFHDSAYDGLWQTQSAWGRLDAPPEFKEEILKIYSEMSLPENLIDPE